MNRPYLTFNELIVQTNRCQIDFKGSKNMAELRCAKKDKADALNASNEEHEIQCKLEELTERKKGASLFPT